LRKGIIKKRPHFKRSLLYFVKLNTYLIGAAVAYFTNPVTSKYSSAS
jgi:hypothetical protein